MNIIEVEVNISDYIDEFTDEEIQEEFDRRGLEMPIEELSYKDLISALCQKLSIIESEEFLLLTKKYF